MERAGREGAYVLECAFTFNMHFAEGSSQSQEALATDGKSSMERSPSSSLSSSGGPPSERGRRGNSDVDDQEYVLRCYSFPGKQGKLKFSIPLRMSLKQYMRLNTGSPSSAVAAAKAAALAGSVPGVVSAYSGLHHRAISPAAQYIVFVHLSGVRRWGREMWCHERRGRAEGEIVLSMSRLHAR